MNKHYQWAVIGAGPAGMATVGMLLDSGIDSEQILWVDPSFTVGDLGDKWQAVPSNTKVKLFNLFLNHCKAFNASELPPELSLSALEEEQTCLLSEVVKPLQWVSQQLKQQVATEQEVVKHLCLREGVWHLQCQKKALTATHTVLAIGSEPKALNYPGIKTIPLTVALDPVKLKGAVKETESIAVFGSSHSAVLVLKNLCDLKVKHLYNFYRSPLKYATYLEERILFDNTGLKGEAAAWAKKNLTGHWPQNFSRHLVTAENIQEYLTECSSAVYAVGFQSRLIDVEGVDLSEYNDKYGIIAPGLFGVGIAFPEGKYDAFMNFEYNVGLWKFMDYLQRVLPIWKQYSP